MPSDLLKPDHVGLKRLDHGGDAVRCELGIDPTQLWTL